jgi:site-specific DNA recombinase
MIAGYCRLSRDDNKTNYASIEDQKVFIKNYANKLGLSVDKIFEDDNVSGYKVDEDDDTVFDRDGFKEMWELCSDGKIEVIIIKDLSRLGRNNPIVELTLNRFKKKNIKVYSIDKDEDVTQNDDIRSVETWADERHVKETSKKVRNTFNHKMQDGTLLMGTHFGYIKKMKTNLLVDETLRPCIELIFKLYIEGLGFIKIANYLNDNTAYPTPSVYFKNQFENEGRIYNHKVTEKWESYHIQFILSNDLYIGTLRTHKKETVEIRGKARKVDLSEQHVFGHHHEAIISEDDFELVQSIRNKRNKTNEKGSAKNEYLFRGFGVCGDCGYHLGGFMQKRKVKKQAYNCSQYTRYGLRVCSNKDITEEDLLNRFVAFLIDTRAMYSDYLMHVDFKNKIKETQNSLASFEKEFEKVKADLKFLSIKKMRDSSNDNDEYSDVTEEINAEIEKDLQKRFVTLKKQIDEIKVQIPEKHEEQIKTAISIMDEIIGPEKPNRKLLEMLLDKIVIYKDRVVEFVLKVNIN